MTVRYWTSRNDANHSNSHAEVDGIEFFKFPYSPYMSDRVGKYMALVSCHTEYDSEGCFNIWASQIHECFSNGKTKVVETHSTTDKDFIFEITAKRLKDWDNENPKTKTD